MDDYNGNHESGFIELLMEGDYKRHCNDGDDLNDGNYNDGDDSDNDSDDDDSNNDSDDELYQLVAVICEATVTYFNKYFNKTSCYDSKQTWWVWVRCCMEGNKKLCYNMIRVKKQVFHNWCQVLQHEYELQHSRYIKLEESVAICLLILGHGICN